MIQEQIWIDKPIDDVWNFIELEFAKVFKCSPSKLSGKEIKAQASNFTGQRIEIIQRIAELQKPNRLVLESENSKDRVRTIYELEADGDAATFLRSSEMGEGISSKMRTFNYKVMGLPILRSGSKKKLRNRLDSIKMMLEGNGETV